jgi:carboxymethylenebutenolidase
MSMAASGVARALCSIGAVIVVLRPVPRIAGLMSATISTPTDATGLLEGGVTVPVAGFPMPAYRAVPKGAGPWPIVLLVPEIFGVRPHIANVARRLAKALGAIVIAPELFVRQGDAKATDDVQTLFAEIIGKVPDTQVTGDLDAAVAWAARMGGDVQRLGITGFCWGGRATWLYAAHNPAVKAGVAWYGRLGGVPTALQPRSPLDVAKTLRAPVLGLYGGLDASIPLDSVEAMRAAVAAGGEAARASSIFVYPTAKHAFFNDTRPNFDAVASADAWHRCIAFLHQKLIA